MEEVGVLRDPVPHPVLVLHVFQRKVLLDHGPVNGIKGVRGENCEVLRGHPVAGRLGVLDLLHVELPALLKRPARTPVLPRAPAPVLQGLQLNPPPPLLRLVVLEPPRDASDELGPVPTPRVDPVRRVELVHRLPHEPRTLFKHEDRTVENLGLAVLSGKLRPKAVVQVRLQGFHDDDVRVQVHAAVVPKSRQPQNLGVVAEEEGPRLPLFYVRPPVLRRRPLDQLLCLRPLHDDVVAQVPKDLEVVQRQGWGDDDHTRIRVEPKGALHRPPVPKGKTLCGRRPRQEKVCVAPGPIWPRRARENRGQSYGYESVCRGRHDSLFHEVLNSIIKASWQGQLSQRRHLFRLCPS